MNHRTPTTQPVNIPSVQIVAVNPYAQLRSIADLTGQATPATENVGQGGNLNAFIDAVSTVMQAADDGGVVLALAGRPVQSWYRDEDRDVNPVEGTAEGAEQGDRVYLKTADGWLFSTWSSAWHAIPFGETPSQRPCEFPTFSGCLNAEVTLGIPPGTLPGEMLWRPSEDPDMNPAGEIFADEDTGGRLRADDNGAPTTGSKSLMLPLVAAAVVAFFVFD